MADNQQTSFSALTTKQKVIGVLTFVIIGFVLYEIIGLFSSGKPPKTVIKPAPQTAAQQKTPSGTMTTVTTSSNNVAPMGAITGAPALTAINPIVPPVKANDELQKQQEQQQVYLESVNQLQLLKVKREIAETNQAIASARLATETANKNMSDLLTQPTLPQLPGGGTAQPIANGLPTENATPTPAASAAKAPTMDVSFTVISVSMKFNHWNAVLGSDNKLYSVPIGDTLFDGSTVAAISKNGVTLTKDGKKRKIRVQTSI